MKWFKRNPNKDLLELVARANRAEAQCEVWKERGDKYAAHNDRLEAALFRLYELNATIVKDAFDTVNKMWKAGNPKEPKGE